MICRAVDCSAPVRPGRGARYCANHVHVRAAVRKRCSRDYNRRRRAAAKAKGICWICDDPLGRYAAVCDDCRAYLYDLREERA